MKTIRCEGMFDLLSPLCHTAPERVLGEKSTVNSLRIIPIATSTISEGYGVSGAEIRTIMKLLVVKYTLQKLGIAPEDLPDEVAEMLYTGGRGTSGDNVKYQVIEEIKKSVPIIDLFGGTINGHFFSSSLRCDFAYVLTKESSSMYPGLAELCGLPEEKLINAAEFKTAVYNFGYGHTRHKKAEVAHLDVNDKNKIQMPYYIEAIPAGTKLLHGFTLVDPYEGSIACFEAALKMFLDYGYLGGRSAAGYGRIRARYFDADNQLYAPRVGPYDWWLQENGAAMKETLLKLTELLPSKADAKASEACGWLLANKTAIQRLIADASETNDLKELFKVEQVTDDNLKKIKTLVKRYADVVSRAYKQDCESGSALYDSLDQAAKKAVGEFFNKSHAAFKVVKKANGKK